MTDESVVEIYKLVRDFLRKNTKYYDDDLLQELVLKVCERIDKFDSTKASFSTFVYMNCRNYYYMYLKSKKEVQSLDELIDTAEGVTLLDTILDETELALDILLKNEKDEYVQYVFETHCSPILKDYLLGYTQKDIAKKYGLQQPNVCTMIKKELKKIRETYSP